MLTLKVNIAWAAFFSSLPERCSDNEFDRGVFGQTRGTKGGTRVPPAVIEDLDEQVGCAIEHVGCVVPTRSAGNMALHAQQVREPKIT